MLPRLFLHGWHLLTENAPSPSGQPKFWRSWNAWRLYQCHGQDSYGRYATGELFDHVTWVETHA